MAFKTKRVYEPAEPSDGDRILVDRLWPRGLTKERAQIDEWMKEIAPSNALRQWYGHVPERWEEFLARYRKELSSPAGAELLHRLRMLGKRKTVTLVFSSKEETYNNARALLLLLKK